MRLPKATSILSCVIVVMLSAGFCHLLADSLEDIEEEVEDFPLGPFLCSCGFLVTLIVDQIAHEYLDLKDSSHPSQAAARLRGQPNSGDLVQYVEKVFLFSRRSRHR